MANSSDLKPYQPKKSSALDGILTGVAVMLALVVAVVMVRVLTRDPNAVQATATWDADTRQSIRDTNAGIASMEQDIKNMGNYDASSTFPELHEIPQFEEPEPNFEVSGLQID